eukprot:8910653-Pyramimonas_sp.AAC.1
MCTSKILSCGGCAVRGNTAPVALPVVFDGLNDRLASMRVLSRNAFTCHAMPVVTSFSDAFKW